MKRSGLEIALAKRSRGRRGPTQKRGRPRKEKPERKLINSNVRVITRPESGLNDTEGRLRECIVIIKTAYREMIEGGVNKSAVRMMRSFLQSRGYEEMVKHLDEKSTK